MSINAGYVSLSAALLALVLGMSSQAVSAGTVSRAWVSGKGNDAPGCGSPTNACRSFQYVHDNIIAVAGEIDVLDPAGYGAVTITKSLSIVNDGVGTAGVQAASGNAITINAPPSESVHLRGLNIDGLGTGANGIVFNSGAGLTVVNCVVRHFYGNQLTGNGILIAPTAGPLSFLISNTLILDNVYNGIYYFPPSGNAAAVGVIDHVTTDNNFTGIEVNTPNATGGALNLTITGSDMSDNVADGMFFASPGSSTIVANIDLSFANNNGTSGIENSPGITLYIGRSVLSLNRGFGISNGGNTFSYGDNRASGNINGQIFGNALSMADKPL